MNRRHLVEKLEQRNLLAWSWHNDALPCDADRSALVTADDALIVINALNRDGSRRLPTAREEENFFIDVNNDGYLSPLDALAIINAINRNQSDLSLVIGSSPASDPNGNGVILGDSITLIGQTSEFAKVNIDKSDGTSQQAQSTTADAAGHFEFVLPIPAGIHTFRIVSKMN